ncbi:ribonuclease E inhibitor RraB [Limnoglobus roseus]|uniref:Regulator of ribonuclease activity B domain-containing protein n=1 Tax=Limnoglobus roseus TaxID=2598579 RepID=A0A5C1AR52_9BACT|nr:ribonuclease E inhibitor RraB [Limnoglobus roseus]QEL20533.1 hypothetical protein PX52LOC_07638 [Limnoglobus roseus]
MQQHLDAALRAGYDVSNDHAVAFDFHFDERADADRMAARVRSDAIEARVGETDAGGGLTVRVVAAIAATHDAISAVEEKLSAIAERCGGVSDGWQTVASKDRGGS